MNNFTRNTIVLAVLWLFSAGVGYYVIQVKQPQEIERVKKEVDLQNLLRADLASLVSQEASTAEETNEVVRKWNARYKVIPDSLTNRGVMQHIHDLTDNGFEELTHTFKGVQRAPEYSVMTFDMEGIAFYRSLYRLIWEIENDEQMFGLRNLTVKRETRSDIDPNTNRPTQEIVVRFSLTLDAYFSGMEGVSAVNEEKPVIPAAMLPAREPASNPFYPAILDEEPPNTAGLVNIEKDALVGIADGKAIFRNGLTGKIEHLSVGDRVHLGRIDEIDPAHGLVGANLNRGGIVDRVLRSVIEEPAEAPKGNSF